MRCGAILPILVLAVAQLSCVGSDRASPPDEGLVRTCAMQLAKNRYEHQVGQFDEDDWPLPSFWVAFYGAGLIATDFPEGDRLAFMRIYAEPRYQPHWRSTFMLTEEARQRVEAQRAQIALAGGRRYLQLMREAIALCEKDPFIVPPPSAEGPDAA